MVSLPGHNELTHWGQVMHIWVSKLTTISSDNGLLPGWSLATIWTNARMLLIGPLGTNFSAILIEIYAFSFKQMHLKIFLFMKMHFKILSTMAALLLLFFFFLFPWRFCRRVGGSEICLLWLRGEYGWNHGQCAVCHSWWRTSVPGNTGRSNQEKGTAEVQSLHKWKEIQEERKKTEGEIISEILLVM